MADLSPDAERIWSWLSKTVCPYIEGLDPNAFDPIIDLIHMVSVRECEGLPITYKFTLTDKGWARFRAERERTI